MDAGGNLGGPPNPPQTGSNAARRDDTAPVSRPVVSGSVEPVRSLDSRIASTSLPACSSRSPRRLLYASEIASSTWRKLGMPCRGSGGKYVPPQKGRPSGVRKTVIGQPP